MPSHRYTYIRNNCMSEWVFKKKNNKNSLNNNKSICSQCNETIIGRQQVKESNFIFNFIQKKKTRKKCFL